MCLSNEFCKKTRFSFQTEKTKNCHAQPKKKEVQKTHRRSSASIFCEIILSLETMSRTVSRMTHSELREIDLRFDFLRIRNRCMMLSMQCKLRERKKMKCAQNQANFSTMPQCRHLAVTNTHKRPLGRKRRTAKCVL